MLEEGKLYVVVTLRGNHWLFKKRASSSMLTGCYSAYSVNHDFCSLHSSHVCEDYEVFSIKPASSNYIAIWNRKFNDNLKFE